MQPNQDTLLRYLVIFITIQSILCGRKTADYVVAQDGSGDFRTITEALKAIPSQRVRRFYISVKSGLYNEYLIVGKGMTNISISGEGMRQTIISGNRHVGPHLGTDGTATVAIFGDGFIARDIAFQNIAGPQNNQSVAVMVKANNAAFFRCRFSGFQDTLYARDGYQFFRECEIYGTIDFIFGDATAVFQKCFIYARRPLNGQSNTITANGRESLKRNSGTVLHNCTITAAPDLRQPGTVKTYLGRPWKTFSTTVIMQSWLDSIINPKGWLEWGIKKPFYAEYKNFGPGADTTKRVQWEKQMVSASEADFYTVRKFIKGETWLPSTGIPYDLDLI